MNTVEARRQTAERKRRVIEYVRLSWSKGIAAGWTEIVAVAEVPTGSMPRVMRELEQDKKVICIGTALDAGRTDMRGSYKVYAPFGTPQLATVTPSNRRRVLTVAPVVKREKYKGVVAPKHYYEWRTPEMTVENYDLYAGRNLAMLARG